MITEAEILAHIVRQGNTDACYYGLSWNGFNIIGDRKSVDEVKRLLNAESIIEALRQRLRCTETALSNTKEALVEARAERDRARQQVSDMSWTPGSYQNGL